MYPLHPNEERLVNSARQAQKYFEFLNSRPQKKYESWNDYNRDLDSWFQQTYHIWNLTSKFPYFLAQKQVALRQRLPPFSATFHHPSPTPQQATPQRQQQQDDIEGVECTIPPVWKRLAAEVIDFIILFLLKVGTTFIAIDFYDYLDVDFLSLADVLFQGDSKLEYKAVIQITHNLLLLELAHRLVVCAFETYCLTGSDDRTGGATPGKAAMGLRVIRCASVVELPPPPGSPPGTQRLLVRPGGSLGFVVSLMRATAKNTILTFFIPASLALFYYRHNRTGYDMLCSTIVIEEPIVRRRNNNNEPAQ